MFIWSPNSVQQHGLAQLHAGQRARQRHFAVEPVAVLFGLHAQHLQGQGRAGRGAETQGALQVGA